MPSQAVLVVAGADRTGITFVATGAEEISGRISVQGQPLKDVSVALAGPVSGATTTNATGSYEFKRVPPGSYAIRPALAGYAFEPADASLSVSVANAVQDFAARSTYSISGTVSGTFSPDLEVSLSGAGFAATIVDSVGHYVFSGLESGDYSLTPSSKGGYLFDPPSIDVSIHVASITGQDFTGSGVWTINGTVDGVARAGVEVNLSGPVDAGSVSDTSGHYWFVGLPDGSYTLTPSLASYQFSPPNRLVVVNGGAVAGQDFVDTCDVSISGAVSGLVQTGVSIELSGASNAVTTTDAFGDFSFCGVPDGDYTVKASLAGGYGLSPSSIDVRVSGSSVAGLAFADTGLHSISGTFSFAGGGVPDALVLLSGSPFPRAISTRADDSGAFKFAGIPNGLFTLTPDYAGFRFLPTQSTVNVSDADIAGVDFTNCAPTSHPSGSRFVAYQADVGHTGSQPCDLLRLPLAQRWVRDFGAPVSYPVVADGRVFVVVGQTEEWNAALIALDEETGATLWGPVDLNDPFSHASAAYDDGTLFVVNDSGLLRALDPTNGRVIWEAGIGMGSNSPPVATQGAVFVSGVGNGGELFAIDEADGGVRWKYPVIDGDFNSPAVGNGRVYVGYGGPAYALQADDGGLLWSHAGEAQGGNGYTDALARGMLYHQDRFGDVILNPATGDVLGSYSSLYTPAFSTAGWVSTGHESGAPADTVRSIQFDGGVGWTFDAGSSYVQTSAITVGPHVVFGTHDGHLWVVDAQTGQVVSSADLPSILGLFGPDEENSLVPLPGFAAADGMLFVPTDTSLAAY